jgi:HAD superfamily hydrolase (TIGR01509 family)
MIKAILMDFNGVIINDEPVQMKAYQKVLAAENITLTEEQYYSCLGMDDRTFVRAAFERAGMPLEEERLARLVEGKSLVWRELISDGVPLFPDAVSFIGKMSRKFKMGIVSMARGANIEYALTRSGLRNNFSFIVSAEMVTRHKPDPECFLLGLSEMRKLMPDALLKPGECLVVEDAPPGVVAGNNAGMKTLAVLNTVDERAMRSARASAVAKSLADWSPESLERVFNH